MVFLSSFSSLIQGECFYPTVREIPKLEASCPGTGSDYLWNKVGWISFRLPLRALQINHLDIAPMNIFCKTFRCRRIWSESMQTHVWQGSWHITTIYQFGEVTKSLYCEEGEVLQLSQPQNFFKKYSLAESSTNDAASYTTKVLRSLCSDFCTTAWSICSARWLGRNTILVSILFDGFDRKHKPVSHALDKTTRGFRFGGILLKISSIGHNEVPRGLKQDYELLIQWARIQSTATIITQT